MKKTPSTLYKRTGDKNVVPDTTKMSPQKRAEGIAKGADPGKFFAKAPLLMILDRSNGDVDEGVSDFAFRLAMLFAVSKVCTGAIELSHKEIASAMKCSERQAQRATAELERSGYFKVSRKHNRRNIYEISDPFTFVAAPSTGVDALRHCAHCHKPVKSVAKHGYCRSCAAALDIARQVRGARRYLGEEATLREVVEHLGLEKQQEKVAKALRRAGVAA